MEIGPQALFFSQSRAINIIFKVQFEILKRRSTLNPKNIIATITYTGSLYNRVIFLLKALASFYPALMQDWLFFFFNFLQPEPFSYLKLRKLYIME